MVRRSQLYWLVPHQEVEESKNSREDKTVSPARMGKRLCRIKLHHQQNRALSQNLTCPGIFTQCLNCIKTNHGGLPWPKMLGLFCGPSPALLNVFWSIITRAFTSINFCCNKADKEPNYILIFCEGVNYLPPVGINSFSLGCFK